MEEKVSISLQEYEELIRAKQKSEQYKNYFLENTQNNQSNRILCAIECKNLYELIKENQERKGKENV